MVCHKIKRADPARLHITAGKVEQRAGNAAATVFLVGKHRADIGRKVAPFVKIIFDNAKTADYSAVRDCHIPLRDSLPTGKTFINAVDICAHRCRAFIISVIKNARTGSNCASNSSAVTNSIAPAYIKQLMTIGYIIGKPRLRIINPYDIAINKKPTHTGSEYGNAALNARLQTPRSCARTP